jgi:hypothetical protein
MWHLYNRPSADTLSIPGHKGRGLSREFPVTHPRLKAGLLPQRLRKTRFVPVPGLS